MANDMATVLRAIAEVETANGRNSYPRFERSFAPLGFTCTVQGHIITGTGTNFTPIAQRRWDLYGMGSACSYGKWQILAHTAMDLGFKGFPSELWYGSQSWVEAALKKQFNKGANMIAKLADAWNSGSFTDANLPVDYVKQVTAAFIVAGGNPATPLVL
jgi:hypothetical protein